MYETQEDLSQTLLVIKKAELALNQASQELKPLELKGWNAAQFTHHFYFRNGQTVSLRQIGYMSQVQKLVKREVIYRTGGLADQIEREATKVRNGSFSYSFYKSYDFFKSAHWAMGGGTLAGYFSGRVQTPTPGNTKYSGKIDFRFFDRFIDVTNHYKRKYGTSNPKNPTAKDDLLANLMGTPFDIRDNWSEPIRGTIISI